MCGITGIYHYGTGKPADRHALEQMTSALAHRGPDDAGIHLDGPVGLGHRRLSILDLASSGHQPMSDPEGKVWLTYNGETYNYRDHIPQLRAKGYEFKSSSDTNVILNLYREYGIDFLDKIDGMFAMGIWDSREQTLTLIRDRIGIKPLYYYDDGKTLLFASELKALLFHPSFKRDINYSSLMNYFRFMSIPDPQSIFKNVRKLPGGHCLTVNRDGVKLRKYWDIESFAPLEGVSFDEAVQDFADRFENCVASHMISDVPVGAFLSGGVDSSGVVAYASTKSTSPIQTFSVAFEDLPEYDESPYAEQVAARCGAHHRNFPLQADITELLPKIIWHCDEPFAVSSSIPLFMLAKETSKHVKVVLTGDGADEIFGGYPWRHTPRTMLPGWLSDALKPFLGLCHKETDTLPPNHIMQRFKRAVCPEYAYNEAFTTFNNHELNGLLTRSILEQISPDNAGVPIVEHYLSADRATPLSRKLYAELKTTLVSEMLTKVDRMTMAFGLEARVPFLDHTLVQWAFSLPDEFKTADGDGKRIVKKAFEDKLPSDMLNRPKHGFNTPLPIWFRGDLRDWTRDILSETRVRDKGLLNPHVVGDMLARHESGERNNANRILAALSLHLWFDQFTNSPTPS